MTKPVPAYRITVERVADIEHEDSPREIVSICEFTLPHSPSYDGSVFALLQEYFRVDREQAVEESEVE
jgi:hypothetical protein